MINQTADHRRDSECRNLQNLESSRSQIILKQLIILEYLIEFDICQKGFVVRYKQTNSIFLYEANLNILDIFQNAEKLEICCSGE